MASENDILGGFFSKVAETAGNVVGTGINSLNEQVPIWTRELITGRKENQLNQSTFKETPQQPMTAATVANPSPESAVVIPTTTLMLIGVGLLAGFILLKD